eukprot:scaffold63379_cov61-Phaeocystis_antarctica.AAC.2
MKARARGMIIADAATLVGGGSGLHEEHHSIKHKAVDRTSLKPYMTSAQLRQCLRCCFNAH